MFAIRFAFTAVISAVCAPASSFTASLIVCAVLSVTVPPGADTFTRSSEFPAPICETVTLPPGPATTLLSVIAPPLFEVRLIEAPSPLVVALSVPALTSSPGAPPMLVTASRFTVAPPTVPVPVMLPPEVIDAVAVAVTFAFTIAFCAAVIPTTSPLTGEFTVTSPAPIVEISMFPTAADTAPLSAISLPAFESVMLPVPVLTVPNVAVFPLWS